MDLFRRTNLANWEERAAPHASSPDYSVERLATEPDFLSDVIRFDRPRLGDVAGLDVVHLQCHIGTDTVSLAKLGARVTGVDFSPAALAQARALAARAGVEVRFVESELYAAPTALGATYDRVYTGVGAMNWLPDVRQWAAAVAALLRPGGRLYVREGHPMLWTLADPGPDGVLAIEYPYFEQPEPTLFDEPGTYVETDHEFVHSRTYEWNHGLGEIVIGRARGRPDAHDARRARLGPVECAARPDGRLGGWRVPSP